MVMVTPQKHLKALYKKSFKYIPFLENLNSSLSSMSLSKLTNSGMLRFPFKLDDAESATTTLKFESFEIR